MEDGICNGQKYIFKNQTIGLPLILAELPKEIVIENLSLHLKSKFHVSLVPIGKIIEKHKVEIVNFEEKIITDFCGFVNENPIEIIGFKNEYRFAWQSDRRSVVLMCDISNLNEFFKLINKKYNLFIETPPTHVTLYTLEPEMGIFLIDSLDIKEKTKIVDVPNLNVKVC